MVLYLNHRVSKLIKTAHGHCQVLKWLIISKNSKCQPTNSHRTSESKGIWRASEHLEVTVSLEKVATSIFYKLKLADNIHFVMTSTKLPFSGLPELSALYLNMSTKWSNISPGYHSTPVVLDEFTASQESENQGISSEFADMAFSPAQHLLCSHQHLGRYGTHGKAG